MQEHGPQNLSLVDAFGSFGVQLLSYFTDLRCRRRGKAEGVQAIYQSSHVATLPLQVWLRSLWSERGGTDTLGVEEDRLSVDTAVPSPHFQADLLKLLSVDGPACLWLPFRLREGGADQLIEPRPGQTNHAGHLSD